MTNTQIDSTFRYYTDDKTPELTLFYNMACDRIDKLILSETQGQFKNGKQIEDSFKEALRENTLTALPGFLWIKLKHYLWKGYDEDRNSSGTIVSEIEKRIIQLMITKLYEIRNFQSHYYHPNGCLFFEGELADFVEGRYDHALKLLSVTYPREIDEYIKRFKQAENRIPYHHSQESSYEPKAKTLNPEFVFIFRRVGTNSARKLTYEGKGFFLSFFLTKGEMVRFLKQRRGAKRDDLRDFKLKHEIYTFYCHREGATRFHYNQDISWIDSMDMESRTEILKMKKSLDLVNYLSDIPDYLFDTTLFPIPSSAPGIGERENLLFFINEHKLFKKIEWSLTQPEIPEKDSKPNNDNRRRINNAIKTQPENHIWCKLREWPEFSFKMSTHVLHRMILLSIWLRDDGYEATQRLFALLIERYQLRRVLQLLGREEIVKKISENEKFSIKLFDYLKDFSVYKIRNSSPAFIETWNRWLKLPVPEMSKMKRNELTKRDLMFKVKSFAQWLPIEVRFEHMFLEDFQKPRNRELFMRTAVHYMIDFKIAPEIEWHWETFSEVAEEVDCTRKENAATCFASQEPDAQWRLRFTPDNQVLCKLKGNSRPFLIGHKAMRNLLIAHLRDNQKPKSLLEAIQFDLNKMISGSHVSELQILDNSTIPATLLGHEKYNVTNATRERIKWLKITLEEQLKNANNIRRAEKNRQVMQCYRLYEWPRRKSNDVEMFLRHNEYNNLSIYHYMLEKKRLNSILEEIRNERNIPAEIYKIINHAKSLDELHTFIIKNTLQMLDRWELQLPENAEKIARKIGVPVYSGSGNLPEHIPFAIHPVLILKHYYQEKFARNPNLNLASDFRKQVPLSQGLYASHYDITEVVQTLLKAGGNENLMKKAIGRANDQLTHDMILFALLQKYDPTISKIDNLFAEPEPLPAKQTHFKVNISIRKRETNSILYTFDNNTMNNLIDYFLVINPPEDNSKIPTLAFNELIKERQRIEQASLIYISAILKFEASVLDSCQDKDFGDKYVDFNKICQMSNISEEHQNSLKQIRNTSFHNDIPKGWTYNDADRTGHPVLSDHIASAKQSKSERSQYYLQGLKPPLQKKVNSKISDHSAK